jgi:glycosyltransferase involved in cell wall biosynthesis
LPPPIGGVETFMQAMLESRAFDGFEVAHCNTTKGRPKETQGKFDSGNYAWAGRHIGRMLRSVSQFRPDVVYLPVAGTWSGFLRDMALAWLAKRGGARLAGHVHGSDFHFVLERGGLDRRLVRAGLGQFDRLLVLGESWKRLLEAWGARCPCEVVPSTLRREVFERAAHARARTADGSARGLFVGQVGRRKGAFDVLEALRRTRDDGLPIHLTFVGPAELEGEWDAVQALRHGLGLEALTEFTGPLQGDPLYARFEAADFFVMPSYTEGLPVVFLEAGAFGLPVITTPVGAIPELIRDGANGLLVTPGDVAAIAGALARMGRDAQDRARMGRTLREHVAAYHPDRVSERVAEALRRTLEAR